MTSWNLIPPLACTINVLCHNVAGPYRLMHLQYIYYAMTSRDLTPLFVHNTFTMPWRRETLPPYLFTIHLLCHDVARSYRLMRLQYMYIAMTSRDLTALCIYNTFTMPWCRETLPPYLFTIHVLCHDVAGPYRLICSQYIYYVMTSRDLTALFVHNTCTLPWRRKTLLPYAFTIHLLCHDVARPYHLICSQYMYYVMTSRDLTALFGINGKYLFMY